MSGTQAIRPVRSMLSTAILAVCSATAWSQTTSTAAPLSQPAPAASPLARERAELEQLRATTQALIDALVGQGLLTRAQADSIRERARQSAPMPGVAATDAGAAPAATAAAAGEPAASGAAVPPVIRVTHVPESVRAQLRDEVRHGLLASIREEGWADSRQVPSWTRALSFGGDLRVRAQSERYARPLYEVDASTGAAIGGACDIVGGNLPAECYGSQTVSPAWSPDLTNTTIPRDRLTLRARLSMDARVSSDTRVALRLTTGSTSGPTSSSQTLGNGLNKSSMVIDRAFLRWEPRYDVRVMAGRMPNPFFGGDLAWPDDIGFDGVAAQGEWDLGPGFFAFGTAGAFPLQELNIDRRDKWLYALQAGAQWSAGLGGTLRAGLALYDFAHIEGVRESEPPPAGARAGTVPYQTSAYPANVRLKGNTLINLNDDTTIGTATPVWGLASRFKPVVFSLDYSWAGWNPVMVGLGLDLVRNTGFDLADIRSRALDSSLDGLVERSRGAQLKLRVGHEQLQDAGQWRGWLAWRRLERDAWVDGFTDTTWHLGGTNYSGWQLGGDYAFDDKTTLGLRWSSTRNLDDGVRLGTGVTGVTAATLSSAPLRIDVLQLDLSTRF